MVISNILSIFAEIFDESLESEGGMGIRDEREKSESEERKAWWLFLQFIPVDFYGDWGWRFLAVAER